MRKTAFYFFLIFFVSVNVGAQDKFSFPKSTDLGLNITNVISSFIGNSNSEINLETFPFVVKVNRKKTAIRFGMGIDLGNANETLAEVEQFVINNYQINGRVGVEKKKYLGHKFGFFYGLDIVGAVRNEESTVSNTVDVTSIVENTVGVGGGPVYGFEYYFNKYMYFGTEGSFYGIYKLTNRKESFEFNPDINSERKITGFDAQITTPTRLYIMIRF